MLQKALEPLEKKPEDAAGVLENPGKSECIKTMSNCIPAVSGELSDERPSKLYRRDLAAYFAQLFDSSLRLVTHSCLTVTDRVRLAVHKLVHIARYLARMAWFQISRCGTEVSTEALLSRPVFL